MKTEAEIRQMTAILESFNHNHVHDQEIIALKWVLDEYPPPTTPQEQPGNPDRCEACSGTGRVATGMLEGRPITAYCDCPLGRDLRKVEERKMP